MEHNRAVEMGEEAVVDFLGAGGTGVASFARGDGDPPHSIPVSYGFDAETGHLFFRLAFGPDSEKRGVVAAGAPVSFVTYGNEGGQWYSVVATGRLESVEDVDVADGVLESLRRVDIPMVDAFESEPRTLSFEFFRLDPETLTGRTEAQSDD
ncbi:pyridoxamine 5'-phosphate oxidase family protein [Halomarina salina]|uniref:Pyridoxamine 5'-phosphate oxidase family protein n=1 Tax=Halomarina salina TaxID=1872699 RepID=A0ABD5RNS7_9EURY|nr:pyridoxamine 5'-phosphate oxidase family protein [Halomarina salina]